MSDTPNAEYERAIERFKARKGVRIRTAEGRCARPEARAEAAAAMKRWMIARGYMKPAQIDGSGGSEAS